MTGNVTIFEKEFVELMDAKACVSKGSGIQALISCIEAMGISGGDEVIISPYTDMGTISSILTARALPVMADLDRESFQLDPDDVERKITENKRSIMPVHIMGQACHMGRIMAIARKYNLLVIEDACQAHLTEYQGKKLETIWDLGCFSFQAGKNISCGEGGGIVGDDKALMEKCFTVQNRGVNRKGRAERIGPKYRMNEFEAALLLPQLENAQEIFNLRNEKACYMNAKLRDFPGVVPQKLQYGTGGSALWVFLTQYKKEHFNNADRGQFIKALRAEGFGAGGYEANGFHRSEVINNHILF